jgi:hypothetical protein
LEFRQLVEGSRGGLFVHQARHGQARIPWEKGRHPICALASGGEVELGRRSGGREPWRVRGKAEGC